MGSSSLLFDPSQCRPSIHPQSSVYIQSSWLQPHIQGAVWGLCACSRHLSHELVRSQMASSCIYLSVCLAAPLRHSSSSVHSLLGRVALSMVLKGTLRFFLCLHQEGESGNITLREELIIFNGLKYFCKCRGFKFHDWFSDRISAKSYTPICFENTININLCCR